MTRLYSKLKRIFEQEGFFYLFIVVFGKVYNLFRSKFYAVLLTAPNFRIEGKFEIRGIRFISFGKNFYSKSGLWIEVITLYSGRRFAPRILIGDGVALSKNVHISCANKISIGNRVLVGSNVLITDNSHGDYTNIELFDPLIPPRQKQLGGLKPVYIGDNVWICDDVKILHGTKIGSGSIIAAGSIVKGDVPEFCIASGNPARPYKIFNFRINKWEFVNEAK